MKLPALFFLLLTWPAMLLCQTKDPVLDSLIRLVNEKDPPKTLAQEYLNVLWYIFRTEEESVSHYPQRLDSLYECCIAGKTSDSRFEKSIKADALFFKGFALEYEHPEAAQPFIESAIQVYAELGDSSKMALSYLQLTIVVSGNGDSLAFARYYDEANLMVRSIHDPLLAALFHCNIGIGCYDFGRYTDVATHLFESLALIEKYKTRELLELRGDIFHNLSSVYRRIGDIDNGLLYAKKAIESSTEIGQDPSIHYNNLGWIYLEKNYYKEALDAFRNARINTSEAGLVDNATSFYGQATCYRNLGDVKTALPLARKAVEMLPIEMNASFGASALMELAYCEFESGMIDKALKDGLLAYQTFNGAKSKRGSSVSAELISLIYKSQGNYKMALMYSDLRYQHQKQIERQQSTRQLAFGEFTRDNAVRNAQKEAEVQAQLDQQRNIRYALIAGSVVLALLVFLFYNRYRFKQRTTIQLEAKNKEVEAARKRAEASEAFKSRFLANMSHEIRTPLHGISGFTDLLLDTSFTEKQRRWVSSIHTSADRLNEVVNDILEISKLEAGEVRLRSIPFSPAQLVSEVTETLRLRAEEKGIHLTYSLQKEVPDIVPGDPTRLYQILVNLAGNAVKFTEKGSVEICIGISSKAQRSISQDVNLTFDVKDTGIGIPPEKLSTIFESFRQAEEDTTARFGGTGLGLTIARELVRLHGSEISVKSEVGKGTVFSFSIHFPNVDSLGLSSTYDPKHSLHFQQSLSILLAEDNVINREIAVEGIHRHFPNAKIIEVADGKECIEQLMMNGIDVVLMDMQMPVMTGTEAAIHIRSQLPPDKRAIPIIALTASGTAEEIEKAMQAGMNRYLGKPFKPAELARIIAEVVDLSFVKSEPDLS